MPCYGQAPAANVANPPAGTADDGFPKPPDVEEISKHSLSHLQLVRAGHTYDVYLEAPDQIVDVLSSSFCGGNAGSRQYSGHFSIVSATGAKIISKIALDPDDNFVESKPHDGLRLFREPKSRQNLVALYQYGSCALETVQFFSVDPDGKLFVIPFIDKDGRTWKQRLTGPNGVIPQVANNSLVFCGYLNSITYDFCDAYRYDGANFQQTANWMTQNVSAPLGGMNVSGEAARAVYDFLSALAEKAYAAAAYYCGAKLPASTGGPVSGGARQAAALENYCTAGGGQCLLPESVTSEPAANGVWRFQVSFQTAGFATLKVGERSTFEFRVAKSSDGYKVLDLPPALP